MKIKYFEDTDTARMEFSDQAVSETREINENLYIDLDEGGNVVRHDHRACVGAGGYAGAGLPAGRRRGMSRVVGSTGILSAVAQCGLSVGNPGGSQVNVKKLSITDAVCD